MTARRWIAAVLALLAFASLMAQVRVNMIQDGYGLGESIFVLYRFFTIWTVTACGVVWAMFAMDRHVNHSIVGCLAMAIIIVGIVYHALLAATHEVIGLEVYLNQVFHTVIPIAFPLYWLGFADKSRLTAKDAGLWMGYPVVYCIVALIRAQFEGKYPYFFLDVDAQGWGGVVLYIIGLAAVIFVVSLIIVAIGRLVSRR